MANFSNKEITFTLKETGAYANYLSGQKETLNPNTEYSFEPHDYMVLVKN